MQTRIHAQNYTCAKCGCFPLPSILGLSGRPFPACTSPFQPDSLSISLCFLCLPSDPAPPPPPPPPPPGATHPPIHILPTPSSASLAPDLSSNNRHLCSAMLHTPLNPASPPSPRLLSSPTSFLLSILLAFILKSKKRVNHYCRAAWFHPKPGSIRQQKGPSACSQGRTAHSWLQIHTPALLLLAVGPSASGTYRLSSLSA